MEGETFEVGIPLQRRGEAGFVEVVWAAFERTALSPLAVLRRLREISVGPQAGWLRQAFWPLIALSSTSNTR
jgi:hypothetical protein